MDIVRQDVQLIATHYNARISPSIERVVETILCPGQIFGAIFVEPRTGLAGFRLPRFRGAESVESPYLNPSMSGAFARSIGFLVSQ
jgi:hypothetical protein